MNSFKAYNGFCIGNDNEKHECIYYDTWTTMYEEIYKELNKDSCSLNIPIDIDLQWGYGISLKRNSKKLSSKSYEYLKNNENLKDFDWYIFQKDILIIHLYNDALSDNEFAELKETLSKNDNINNICIYDMIQWFKTYN